MHDDFSYQMPTRIVWHSPAREAVAAEVQAIGASSALLVTDPGLVATGLPGEVQAALAESGVDVAVHADVADNPTAADVAAAQ